MVNATKVAILLRVQKKRPTIIYFFAYFIKYQYQTYPIFTGIIILLQNTE